MVKKSDDDKKPEDPLADLRKLIDGVDNDVIELLNKRAQLAREIGDIKIQRSQRMYVPERERALLTRLLENNPGPLPPAGLKLIYKEIIRYCSKLFV